MKEDFIFSDIVRTEVTTRNMLDWLSVLPQHKFEPRHFESDAAQRSPLAKALANVGRARDEAEDGVDNDDDDEEPPVKEKDLLGEEPCPAEVAAEI